MKNKNAGLDTLLYSNMRCEMCCLDSISRALDLSLINLHIINAELPCIYSYSRHLHASTRIFAGVMHRPTIERVLCRCELFANSRCPLHFHVGLDVARQIGPYVQLICPPKLLVGAYCSDFPGVTISRPSFCNRRSSVDNKTVSSSYRYRSTNPSRKCTVQLLQMVVCLSVVDLDIPSHAGLLNR